MDGMGVWQVATRPLCVRMASNLIRVLKRASRPDGRCTVKCMLLQKGAVNYCGCISRIEGAYIRIVGASAPTKRYKITPLPSRSNSRSKDGVRPATDSASVTDFVQNSHMG